MRNTLKVLAVALSMSFGMAMAAEIQIEHTDANASAAGVGGTLSSAGTDGKGYALDGGTQSGSSSSWARSSNPHDEKSKASAGGETNSSSLTGGVSSKHGYTYGTAGNVTGYDSGSNASMTTITVGHGHSHH